MDLMEVRLEKIMKKIVKKNGCWFLKDYEFEAYPSIFGMRGNRWMWIAHNKRKIPKGKFVLHKCDNPACINPEHLYLGTALQNSDDMQRKYYGTKPELTMNNIEKEIENYLTMKDTLKMMQENDVSRSECRIRYWLATKRIRSARFYSSRLLLKEDVMKLINDLKTNPPRRGRPRY